MFGLASKLTVLAFVEVGRECREWSVGTVGRLVREAHKSRGVLQCCG